MCYNRIPMGGGSCFGVTDPSELRPSFRETERARCEVIKGYTCVWRVKCGGEVIGEVEEVPIGGGKFHARVSHYRIPMPGDFASLEEAGWAVFAEYAKPPF